MRGLLMVLLVLATLLTPLAPPAHALALEEDEATDDAAAPSPPPTPRQRPPPEVLQKVEKNLLSLFGFNKRPKPVGKVVIPEAMVQLYKQQTGMDLDTAALPLPGRLTRSANTVRSFPHKGEQRGKKARSGTGTRTRDRYDITGGPSRVTFRASTAPRVSGSGTSGSVPRGGSSVVSGAVAACRGRDQSTVSTSTDGKTKA